MATWFTADTHFGHSNIIRYCGRPFSDVINMDEQLIKKWNLVVAPDDVVWHLGDFCFKGPSLAEQYLEKLNGQINLIWGNHDNKSVRSLSTWHSSQAYAEITLDDNKIVLCHYSLRTWNNVHKGALHFYGHSHGTLPGDSQSCDVGVDVWQYKPVSLAEIQTFLKNPDLCLPEDHSISNKDLDWVNIL